MSQQRKTDMSFLYHTLCYLVYSKQCCTVMNDIMVHEVLHKLDCSLSIRHFFMRNQPVNKLLSHKTIRVRSQMVSAVLYQLAIMYSQPSKPRQQPLLWNT